jgi:hypothetical protein
MAATLLEGRPEEALPVLLKGFTAFRATRRRLAGCALLALAALGGDVWWSTSPGRVTRANYECIREGMTKEEVSVLLGPPRDGGGRPARRNVRLENGAGLCRGLLPPRPRIPQ